MSSNTNATFTKEQLFASLENDGIIVNAATLIQAKINGGEALCIIGSKYKLERLNYSKAMAWYQLAANVNHPLAYFNIGLLYKDGEGVVQDYDAAMDYFLKAAAGNNSFSMIYIGALFSEGKGVPLDKYKTLEWYYKSNLSPSAFKELEEKGLKISIQDKKKTVYQLVNETIDIRREYIKKREDERNTLCTSKEKEIQDIKNELKQKQHQIDLVEKEKQQQAELFEKEKQQKEELLEKMKQQQADLLEQKKGKHNNGEELLKLSVKYLEQQLKEKDKTTSVFEALVNSKNDEIDLLKKEIQRYGNLERENRELRRNLDKCQEPTYSARANSSTYDTNGNNNITDVIIRNSTELDNTIELYNQNEHDSIVKIENSNSSPCQGGNKKRKVSSIGTYGHYFN